MITVITSWSVYFLGIQNVEISQIVSLWQHLALQKTCLMSEHSDEDPFLGICSDFKCRPLTSKLKKQLDRLEDKKKEELMVQLNEYILVHLNDPGYSINPETRLVLHQFFTRCSKSWQASIDATIFWKRKN